MKTFIIAEAGINHCGSLQRACDMVRVARDAGADAVKFQSYIPTRFGAVDDKLQLLKDCHLDEVQLDILSAYCARVGIEFMATPFQFELVKPLVRMGVKRMKISSQSVASSDALLEEIHKTFLPVIISAGLCSLQQLQHAMAKLTILKDGKKILPTPLYCISEYPAPQHKVEFRYMRAMKEEYGTAGYSDHTIGIFTCVAAAALGADVVEKHLTLDRTLPGPDQSCSADPKEFAAMVREIRACTI